MTTFEQMDSNFAVMSDLSLSEGEKRELKLASLLPETYFCQSCRECMPTCPEGVEIPTLMRASMYAEAYGNSIQAEETIATVPAERGLQVCADCPSCEARCSRKLPIGDRLRGLAPGLEGVVVMLSFARPARWVSYVLIMMVCAACGGGAPPPESSRSCGVELGASRRR